MKMNKYLYRVITVIIPVAFTSFIIGGAEPKIETLQKQLAIVTKTIDSGMKTLKINEQDVCTRHDFIPSDAYRLPLIDIYLGNPLSVIQDSYKTFSPWLLKDDKSLSESIVNGCEILGNISLTYSNQTYERKELADVLMDFYRKWPAQDTPREIKAEELQVIPKIAREYLAVLLQAIDQAIELHETAFSKLNEADWIQLQDRGTKYNLGMPPNVQVLCLKEYHAKIDTAKIQQATLFLLPLIDRLPELVKALKNEKNHPAFHLVYATSAGRIEFGGGGKNTYNDDALLTFDLGGNDTYNNSAGGSLFTPQKISVSIDLSGNDFYESKTGFAQGAGVYGVGILVDCAGNDMYKAKDLSQGVGHVGIGLLWDWSGDDKYTADTFGQGAGMQGIGLLRDDAGKDQYQLGMRGQGFGSTLGFGILQDRTGNDTYTAKSQMEDTGRAYNKGHFISLAQGYAFGNRDAQDNPANCTSAGIGLLTDWEGNDIYIADVFGQGGSYWYGIGILFDNSGNDSYQLHDYGQGAGIHMGVGILMDFAGNDKYNGYRHSLGHALDRSVGCLIDFAGDDVYKSGGPESHGSAVKPYAVAFFADLKGNDSYINGTPGYVRIPDSQTPDQWPKAFFMDLDNGQDTYKIHQGNTLDGKIYQRQADNNKTWITNNYGWGIDK